MENKTYKAMYGEVKTGDYVVCVTNDYMHRSTDVDIGKVSNDGYVYIGVHKQMGYNRDTGDWYVEKVKPIRKEAGGFGAVCKVNPSDVPKDKKEEIEEALQIQAEKMKGKCTREFKVKLHFETVDTEGNVLEDYVNEHICKTSSLSQNADDEAIYKQLVKNMKNRYSCYHYPIAGTVHKVDLTNGERKEVIKRSTLTYEEVV